MDKIKATKQNRNTGREPLPPDPNNVPGTNPNKDTVIPRKNYRPKRSNASIAAERNKGKEMAEKLFIDPVMPMCASPVNAFFQEVPTQPIAGTFFLDQERIVELAEGFAQSYGFIHDPKICETSLAQAFDDLAPLTMMSIAKQLYNTATPAEQANLQHLKQVWQDHSEVPAYLNNVASQFGHIDSKFGSFRMEHLDHHAATLVHKAVDIADSLATQEPDERSLRQAVDTVKGKDYLDERASEGYFNDVVRTKLKQYSLEPMTIANRTVSLQHPGKMPLSELESRSDYFSGHAHADDYHKWWSLSHYRWSEIVGFDSSESRLPTSLKDYLRDNFKVIRKPEVRLKLASLTEFQRRHVNRNQHAYARFLSLSQQAPTKFGSASQLIVVGDCESLFSIRYLFRLSHYEAMMGYIVNATRLKDFSGSTNYIFTEERSVTQSKLIAVDLTLQGTKC